MIPETPRTCGKCTLCCKLLRVNAVNKPAGQWCQHCKPKGGCSIYDHRPQVCAVWECGWLMWGDALGDIWFPAKSHMVISPELEEFGWVFVIIVDPSYPNRWREEPYFSKLKQLSGIGLRGSWDIQFKVRVQVGKKLWLIAPDKAIEQRGGDTVDLITSKVVDGKLEYMHMAFENEEKARELIGHLNAASKMMEKWTDADRLDAYLHLRKRGIDPLSSKASLKD